MRINLILAVIYGGLNFWITLLVFNKNVDEFSSLASYCIWMASEV